MLSAVVWLAVGVVAGFAVGLQVARRSYATRTLTTPIATRTLPATHVQAPQYVVTRETPSGTVLQLFSGVDGGAAKRAFESHSAAKEPGAVVFTADGVERGRVVTRK